MDFKIFKSAKPKVYDFVNCLWIAKKDFEKEIG